MSKDITLKDVCLDVLISTVLITGAWFTRQLGLFFFPQGIPISDSILIYARALISILWAVSMVVRYTANTYKDINKAILEVTDTPTWQTSRSAVISSLKYLWAGWKNIPRYFTILVLVIGLSLPLFIFTQNSADLWLPPAYGAAALLFAYIFERENFIHQGTRRYWLVILILFCIIQIAMGIGIVDALSLNNANIWSEVWELIVQFPHIQLSTANNFRVLISMSIMYLVADHIYKRHMNPFVDYTNNVKQYFNAMLLASQRLPAFSMI